MRSSPGVDGCCSVFVTLTALAISCCCQSIPFQQQEQKGVTRDANDDVSLTMNREFIRSKGGPVEERNRPRGRRLTGILYKEQTSGFSLKNQDLKNIRS